MPEPSRGESLSDFAAKYMGSKEARKSFPNAKQRYAVMRSKYKKEKKS